MTRATDLYHLAHEFYDRRQWAVARKLFDAADELLVIEAGERELEGEHARPTLVPTPCDTEWP